MKTNKKIIGLILAGGLLIGAGFYIGNIEYEASLAPKENTEQVTSESEYQEIETTEPSTEEKQKEILKNATDKELELATEKTLEESFDPTKYKVEVDDIGDAVIIDVIIRYSDYTGISQDALTGMIVDCGMDTKMIKFANMIHETYQIAGREKKILFAVSDDNNNVIYAITND